MSVINIQGIQRQGRMVQQERMNEKSMILHDYNMKVNAILSTNDKAMDVLDTINFMYRNGFRRLYDEWFKGKGFILHWSSGRYDGFTYYAQTDKKKETTSIFYKPTEGKIEFHWNGYGMVEGYAHDEDYFLDNMRFKGHDYLTGLEQFAIKFEPLLDAFIDWANGFS